MIFPALYRFAKARGLLGDTAFEEKTLHCALLLRADGSLASVVTLTDKTNKRIVKVAKLPFRGSKAIACLGADTLGRVVPGFDPEANKFAIQTQQLFRDQLAQVHADAPHPGIPPVLTFLERLHTDEATRADLIARLAEQKPSDWVTFMVEGIEGSALMPEWPAVQAWWRERQSGTDTDIEETPDESAALVPCMVTGKLCVPVAAHGARITVAPGGNPTGTALVSSNKPAFGSYGFESATVSPMSEDAVEGYVRAVNWLGDKRNPDYHTRTADTIYLFWSDQPLATLNPGKAIELGTWDDLLAEDPEAPAPSAVPIAAKRVFSGPHTGQLDAAQAADASRFYCLALSGSSARTVVRSWIDQALPVARTHVEQWFADLTVPLDRTLQDQNKQVIAEAGALHSRWPLWQLSACLQGKGESAKTEIAQQRQLLWEAALTGRPLPLHLLVTAVSRIPAAGDVHPVRAALIRCALLRLSPNSPLMNPEPDLSKLGVAFHCGRLLRVLQGIQNTALGETNSTVVSKFYAGASATPGSVFGLLLAKAQPHLGKFRPDKPGLAGWFENQLTEIVAAIVERGGFPSTNNPVAQGEFALGFYYQRTLTRRQKPDADTETAESA
ncbi:MAG: type I-C CRISPR-associated protein Cas8c/Csd1 [Opitutaceae bacterium]|jgi:CRISPR-associated protein Csd1